MSKILMVLTVEGGPITISSVYLSTSTQIKQEYTALYPHIPHYSEEW